MQTLQSDVSTLAGFAALCERYTVNIAPPILPRHSCYATPGTHGRSANTLSGIRWNRHGLECLTALE